MKRVIHASRYAAALAATLSSSAIAQRDFSDVEIKSTKVAGNVYMLEGRGGNIGVSVGVDGILIIDDQFAPLADKIRAALMELGEGKLRFILNTHWHGDHTGGNADFGPEATIIAHANVRNRLATVQRLRGRAVGPQPAEALPVITFHETLSVHFNGEELRVLHLPHGHTDGDSVIFFAESKVIHMGDLLFNGMFPFVDLEHGGDVEGYARNVKTVIDQAPPDARIIAGHGPLASLDDLKTYHRMLSETIDFVRKGIAAGKNLDTLQSEGVPDKWRPWGDGFIKTDVWVKTIQTSLTREGS